MKYIIHYRTKRKRYFKYLASSFLLITNNEKEFRGAKLEGERIIYNRK